MKRRRLILIGALLLLAATVIVLVWPRGPKEPVYQGRLLSEWISETQGHFMEANRRDRTNAIANAQQVIRANATNALPWLMSEFTKPDLRGQAALKHWINQHTGLRLRFRIDTVPRARAGFGLAMLGPALTPALPELAPYLGDPMNGSIIANAFGTAGPAALPHFAAGIRSTNSSIEMNSFFGLVRLAQDEESAVPVLLQAFSSSSATLRMVAAGNLSELRFHPELTIPAVAAATSDADASVRQNATSVLTVMRWNSNRFLPELRHLLQDTNPVVVLAASNALHLLESTNLPPRRP